MDLNAPATKGDIRDMMTALRSLSTDIVIRLDGHDAHLHRLSVGFARMQGDITEMKVELGGLSALRTEVVDLKTTVLEFATQSETSKRKWAYQEGMLMDHEARLKSLERKPQ